MLVVEDAAIPGIKIVTPKKHGDVRGFFSEVYNRKTWAEAGLDFGDRKALRALVYQALKPCLSNAPPRQRGSHHQEVGQWCFL